MVSLSRGYSPFSADVSLRCNVKAGADELRPLTIFHTWPYFLGTVHLPDKWKIGGHKPESFAFGWFLSQLARQPGLPLVFHPEEDGLPAERQRHHSIYITLSESNTHKQQRQYLTSNSHWHFKQYIVTELR